MFADFAARGRSGLQGRELDWSAPVKLAAVQSSPWLQSGSYLPKPNKAPQEGQQTSHQGQADSEEATKQKDGGEKPRKEGSDMTAQENKNPKRIQQAGGPGQQDSNRCLYESKYLRPRKAIGEHSDTHNPKGTERRSTKEERGQSSRGRTTHQHRDNPTRRKEKREARRQHKTGGERAHENQRGCSSSALTGVQWGSWNIKDEYLSAAVQSNAEPFQSGGEGSTTPHRAMPLMPQ